MSESVVFETSLGDIQLELYWNHAPKVPSPPLIPSLSYSSVDVQKLRGAVQTRILQWSDFSPNNICESKSGYSFQSADWHDLKTIPKDFMVQGGDPTGTGRGGTSIYGQKFEDELHPELRFTGAGILAMANSGPNTNGSQFFLTLGPTPYLDGKHTIFGRVSSGMRVVQRLGAVAVDAQDRSVLHASFLKTDIQVISVGQRKTSKYTNQELSKCAEHHIAHVKGGLAESSTSI
ncbi:hypothetical protein HHX47_DHR1000119 [Lentinula edodes]|nr:hypothetical protein HHX47_DHR1000119 [Lentinula edodes]